MSSDTKPACSVIITTHNRPTLLRRAVASVRAASRKNMEVVVVDDASSDETAAVCQQLAHINYVRVERNQGVAGARNLGLLASRGEFLSFLDDDDVRLPQSLDQQLAALAARPDAGLIYGGAIIGAQDGSPTSDFYPAHYPQGDVFWELLTQNFMPCGSVVFRRACLYRVGLLDDSVAGIDDWDLWVRIAACYPVLALARPMMIWRKSTPASDQGSSRAVKMVELSTRQFNERWRTLPRVTHATRQQWQASRRKFSRNMTNHLLWETVRALMGGLPLAASRNVRAAARLHPAALASMVFSPASFPRLLTGLRAVRPGVRTSTKSL